MFLLVNPGMGFVGNFGYVFKLHTNNPDKNVDNYQVEMGKKKLNLLEKIAANQEPYSTIEEVK